MRWFKVLCAGFALLGVAATVSGKGIFLRHNRAVSADSNNAVTENKPDTLRQVTVLMRHGERSPADTYPNDPYVNSSMEPFGWGQLTKSGRRKVYKAGEFLRERYGSFLGDTYSPEKYWLQTSDIDRTKMTGMILSAALWKPNEEQTFVPNMDWQPVSLHYWDKEDDKVKTIINKEWTNLHQFDLDVTLDLSDLLLLIWDACPRVTLERTLVDNSTEVKKFNDENKKLFEELTNISGMSIKDAVNAASLASTLTAEATMGLALPEWTNQYYPDRLDPAGIFALEINTLNDPLKKLNGGPFVSKMLRKMLAKSQGTLKPDRRKMYAYVGHDSTVVNVLNAMGIWDRRLPNYGCMIMFELHEENGAYNVQIFQKDSVESTPRALTVPGCKTVCPLEDFAQLMQPLLLGDQCVECKVDDPDYVIPPQPVA